MNALAAIAAARSVGVPPSQSVKALASFRNVKRRMEVKGSVDGVTVYDDFAHHPTAIETTVAGLRTRIGGASGAHSRRARTAFEHDETRHDEGATAGEPRQTPISSSATARAKAATSSAGISPSALAPLGDKAQAFNEIDPLVKAVAAAARPGDHVLVMSNGGFGGVHQKLLDALSARPARRTRVILYLHGFRSSPQSFKARVMRARLAELGRLDEWQCPVLPVSPREAIALAESLAAKADSERRHACRQFARRLLRDVARRKARLARGAAQSGGRAAARPEPLSRRAAAVAWRRQHRRRAASSRRTARARGRRRSRGRSATI